jgi:hypothetical protein
MNINFSIPVTLFDYRVSDNPLYSYAKLKIFYIGLTADKRLFTEKFSNRLIKTLPYVPVVGYYDDEEEDFKGHNLEVQNIYGIVPEDTEIEFVEEDDKKYVVCDVILYTGRKDKTGKIAQKIVGKPHSLELSPEDTKYKINRDKDGKIENIEFTEGSLLGLSVLGDDEKPAFTGSGFFDRNFELMQIMDSFKEELEKFTKKQKRGEMMEKNLDNALDQETVETEENLTGNEEDLDVATLTENEQEEFQDVEENDNSEEEDLEEEENLELDNNSEEEEEEEEEFSTSEGTSEEPTKEERFLESFIKVSYDEVQEKILGEFYAAFGDETFVVQWSPYENEIIYYSFSDYKYHKVMFTDNENGFEFGESVAVKPRYLTEEEINSLWGTEDFNDSNESGTEQENSSNNTSEVGTENEFEEEEEETEQQEETNTSEVALNQSERKELETFRTEKKVELIESFRDDLGDEFTDEVVKKAEEVDFETLDTILSKEFTRVTKEEKVKKQKFSPLFTLTNKETGDRVVDLINYYKDKN